MAQGRELKGRIKSIEGTRKITRSMEMVATSKLKRAQDRVVAARPFANKMTEVLSELASHTEEDFHHPLLDARGDERYLLVLVTADKGLAGAFTLVEFVEASKILCSKEKAQPLGSASARTLHEFGYIGQLLGFIDANHQAEIL